MNIKGKYVILRAIEKADLPMMREMLNDPEMENFVVGWAFPISEFQQEQWYLNHIEDRHNLRFIVETVDDGPLGIATLTDIDWKNRCAMHGMKLANKSHRGRGIGTDTVMALMRYAFDELQLHRLDGCWFDENTASKNMYLKCGWKVEGCKRAYIYKQGHYRDLMETGILASDYYELIQKNHYWDV
jgi:RimJ/RimL family protein N-acetyltransferase